LQQLLNSGELVKRGIYDNNELEIIVGWARDDHYPLMQIEACNVLAACLHRTDTQFNISKQEVTSRISDKTTGCLTQMLHYVLQKKIQIHREIEIIENEQKEF